MSKFFRIFFTLIIFFSFKFHLFADDFHKIKQKDQEGISGKSKIFWQFICACIIAVALYSSAETKMHTSYIVPFFKDVVLDLGPWFIFISIFIIIGSSNAVNLTDGLDGLAILPVIIITAALGGIAWASGNIIAADYLYIPHIVGTGELLE